MCGIVGIYDPTNKLSVKFKKNFITQALYASGLRGLDGSGVFYTTYGDKPEVYWDKRPMQVNDYIQLNRTKSILDKVNDARILVGHTRAATQGRVSWENTQPFQHEHITLVHNGTIWRLSTLHDDWRKFTSDSELMSYAIALEGYQKVIPKIDGSAALAWHDAKTDSLYLYRNKERPLYFAYLKGSNSIVFGSECNMLKWIAERNEETIEEEFDVGENQVVIFSKDKIKDIVVETIKPNPPPPIKIVDYREGLHSGWDRWGGYRQSNYPQTTTKVIKLLDAKEVILYLKTRGLSKGQKVQFKYRDIELAKPTSKHGKITGTMLVYPWADVGCYGISRTLFKQGDTLEGTIVHVEGYQGTPSMIIVNNKLSKVADAEIKIETSIIGPGGKLISEAKFTELVKHGCGSCQCDIFQADSHKLKWVSDMPICPNCPEWMYN